MRFIPLNALGRAVAAVLLSGGLALHAQSLAWDTDPFAAGAQGGSGNWVGPNFWLNAAGNQTWTDGLPAVFGGTAGTVTVNAPVAVGGMTFTVPDYTINGTSTLTLANPIIDVATPDPNPDEGYFPSAVISAPIGGSLGLVKNGVGYLFLSGSQANTFTGTTFINGGSLDLFKTAGTPAINGDIVVGDNLGGPGYAGLLNHAANQIADTATVTVNSNGYWVLFGTSPDTINVLELNGGFVSGAVGLTALRSLANATTARTDGSINLGGAVRTFDIANGAAAIDVLMSSSGSGMGITNGGVMKIGAGTLEITGPNRFTSLQINGGTIRVADVADAGIDSPLGGGSSLGLDGGTLAVTATTSTTLNRAITLGPSGGTIAPSSFLTLSGVISGSGGLTAMGRTLILTGTNTFTGPVTVSSGQLAVPSVTDSGVPGPLGAGNSILIGDGSGFSGFSLEGFGTSSTNRSVFVTGEVSLSPGNGHVTFAGPISGTGYIELVGPGVVEFSGTNNFSGGVFVYNSTLRITNGNAIPDNAEVFLSTGNTPAAFQVNNSNETIGSLAGGSANTGAVTLGTGTLTIGANNHSTTFDGVISGSGNIVKIGSGSLTLTRASTFSGSMTIRSGIVSVDDVANAGIASPLGAGANLILGGAGTQGTLVYTGANNDSFARTVTLAGSGGRITVSNAAAALVFDGNITGSGALAITGPGTVVFSSLNDYTGATTVNGGTLTLNNGIPSAGGAITVAGGANLVARSTVNRAISGSGTITATGPLTIGNASSVSGFNFGGTLNVGTHQVFLADANVADLGSQTLLGGGAQLNSANGIRLPAGRFITTASLGSSISARISGSLINNGSIAGPALAAAPFLHLAGDVTGTGTFSGRVRFSDSFSPGDGAAATAAIMLETYLFDPAHVLTLQLGGVTPGSQHDQLKSLTGTQTLDGTLTISLINGYQPLEGHAFTLLTGPAISGGFDAIDLPPLPPSLAWLYSQTPTTATLSVIPEPSAITLLVAGGLLLAGGWRKNGRKRSDS